MARQHQTRDRMAAVLQSRLNALNALQELTTATQSGRGSTEKGERYLKIFISEAYSVLECIEKTDKELYNAWKSGLDGRGRGLVNIVKDERTYGEHLYSDIESKLSIVREKMNLSDRGGLDRARAAWMPVTPAPFGGQQQPTEVEAPAFKYPVEGEPTNVADACAEIVEIMDLLIESWKKATT